MGGVCVFVSWVWGWRVFPTAAVFFSCVAVYLLEDQLNDDASFPVCFAVFFC